MGFNFKEATFAEELKRRLGRQSRVEVEIRHAGGSQCHRTSEQLLRAMQAAGISGRAVEISTTLRGGISIEAGIDSSKLGLAIQSALKESGISSDFLVHTRVPPKLVILHLGRNCLEDEG